MKKIFTLAAAILASLSLTWAATETQPSEVPAKDNAIVGTSYTIASDYNAGSGNKIDPMTSGGVKFRLNKNTSGISNAIEFTVNEGYKITSIAFCGYANDNSKVGTLEAVYIDGTEEANKLASIPSAELPNKKSTPASFTISGFEATSKVIVAFSSTNLASQGCIEYTVTYEELKTCTDPEAVLTLSKTSMFVNEEADLTFTTNSTGFWTSEVTLNGETASPGTDYNMTGDPFSLPLAVKVIPLKAGTFEITLTQEAWDGYCAVEEKVTAEVSAANPVTTVTIDGPTAGVIGQELTYTATAEGATDYAWFVDGVIVNNNSNTFVYTAVKGNHVILCLARNQFNKDEETDTWIKSNEINLAVTKVCGELIKATHTAGKTADVTGVVGGTTDKNTANDGKFGGKGQYFGITLANGTFMVGDEINVHTTTAAGQGTLAFYADKNGSTLIYDTESAGVAGDNQVVLTNAFAGKSTIYVCRTEGNTWNGYVDYISVTRSCEDSNDASIASLTINGEKVEENDGVFAYTVSAKENLAQVEVVYTINPLATATPASGFNVNVPAAGDPANTQVITVTAEDGTTQKAYTVSVTKSASLSNDATLKALSVEGFELTPAFDPAVTAYNITKAYSAELPAVGLVTATANDANATVNVAYNELVASEILVQVLAEDGETANTYSITVLSAAAKKDLLEASFSNGANGYIKDGNIKVPYLYGTEEPEFVAAKFWKADGEPSAAVVDGQLVVTGVDASEEKYTIEYVAVTPMEASYDLITFTEVPSYIYSIYGWDENKGIKFSKDVEEASKKRISEGQDRIYIALPAAESVILTGGSTGARPIKVTVNGVVDEKVTSTPKTGETVTIALNQAAANFVGIESNGNSGDAGFTKMQLVKGTSTALDNTEAEGKAAKVVRDGQLLILKNGVLYNAQGAIVK